MSCFPSMSLSFEPAPVMHNQSLQQTLDPVAVLASAKPAPASIAAEPRRYGALRFFEETSSRMWFDSFDSLVTQQFSSTTK